MNVNIENTSSLGRKLEFTVPNSDIIAKEQEKVNELSKTVSFKGFRRGKVPVSLIKQRFGKDIRKEVVAAIMEDCVKDTLDKENFNLADRPSIDDVHDKAGEDLKFIVNIEILPEIELKDYAQLQAEKVVVDITDKEVDDAIERMRNSYASWKKKDTALEAIMGDKVIIDFVGYMNGEPFENGSGNDLPLELGSNSFIPGFEKGLVGVKAGENRDLNLTFPKEYGKAELAGKKVLFKVTVKSVEEKTLAELDDEFARKLNVENGDKTKIRETVKSSLEESVKDIVETKLRDSLLDNFVEQNPIEIPNSLLEKEKINITEELKRRKASDSMTDEEIEQEAKKRLSIVLLLNAVIKKHDIKPDPERVRAKVQESAAMFGQSEYIEKMYYESEELMRGISNIVVSDQATDLLLEHANIKEKQSTFEKITNTKK